MDFFVHESSFIDDGATVGAGTKIWHFSHIMTDCIIGQNCNIGQNVVISPKVILGNNVKIQNNVSVHTGVVCEDDVFLGPSMVFTNVVNPRSAIIRRDKYQTTTVKKGASIGANATIICGNNLGCRLWMWIWRWCSDTTRGTFYNRSYFKFPKVWWCAGHHQILGISQHLEASPGPVSEARPTGQLRLQTVRSSIGLGILEASGSWLQPIVAHKATCTAS